MTRSEIAGQNGGSPILFSIIAVPVYVATKKNSLFYTPSLVFVY